MHKKVVMYFVGFLILASFNIYICASLYSKSQKSKFTSHLLSEIEHATDNQTQQTQFSIPSAPLVLGTYEAQVETADARAVKLKIFFRTYNSILYDHAEFIVTTADKYGLDYRLIPAIAMQESTLCKFIPPGSNNCWGYGIYGDKVTRFSSLEEGIETVSRGLKLNYVDKGLTTPETIMRKYTPPSTGSWANGVNTVLGWLE